MGKNCEVLIVSMKKHPFHRLNSKVTRTKGKGINNQSYTSYSDTSYKLFEHIQCIISLTRSSVPVQLTIITEKKTL